MYAYQVRGDNKMKIHLTIGNLRMPCIDTWPLSISLIFRHSNQQREMDIGGVVML